jgi:iron(III) transport system substrate-binding protein
LAKVPSRFSDPNGKWVGISGRARTVVYNSETITDPTTQLPDDLMGFTDPKWNGLIGWAPTNGSFQAMVTAMRIVWGEAQTREWLLGIQANNPTVYANNTPIVEAVGKGEVTVGFVNHYYLYRFLAENPDFPAKNYFLPSGGPGSLIMVSGAGILASAENHLNATRFLNYLLSDTGQQYFASQTYEYPVVEGIVIASGLAPLSALDEIAIDIPLGDLEDLQGTQDLLLDLGIIE